ncbi:MAG: hypothetical protein ACYCZB_03535 [Acidiphilium sp.]
MASRDKAEAFRRLAENRTNEALEAIRKIGNLSNRANYSFEAAQVEKVFDALRRALEAAEAKFGEAPESDEQRFTL